VDNFVDNYLLTGRKARLYAGFNKMLKRLAKKYPFKINHLQIQKMNKKNKY